MAHTIPHQEDGLHTTAFVLSLIAGLWSLAMDSMSRQGVFGSWMPAERQNLAIFLSVSVSYLIIAAAILAHHQARTSLLPLG